MRVLVTGATGFLGQAVVNAFLRDGYRVRALVRPESETPPRWRDKVELTHGDLRIPGSLEGVFADVDVLVHLGVAPSAQGAETLVTGLAGTENLLDEMCRSRTRRLVLAGSLSAYDLGAVSGELTESSPLEADPYSRDDYVVAKVWQERVALSHAAKHGLELTILRPGVIWGPGAPFPPTLGVQAGRVLVLFGARTTPALTYVENCADCFVAAAICPAAVGRNFNVVDAQGVTSWQYAGVYLRAVRPGGIRVVVPFPLARLAIRAGSRCAQLVLGPQARLPSLFIPRRFEARFKPLRYSTEMVRDVLGWSPRWSFEEAIEQTFPTGESTS
jgi:nucleoside-diphosphate-sugar epimerase